MSDDAKTVAIGLMSIFGMILLILNTVFVKSDFRSQAIERGYALHCPATGDFAWKGECDDE